MSGNALHALLVEGRGFSEVLDEKDLHSPDTLDALHVLKCSIDFQ